MTDLFLALTGLADGLAPKERRYAKGAIRPNNLGSPASVPLHLTAEPGGNSALLFKPTSDCGRKSSARSLTASARACGKPEQTPSERLLRGPLLFPGYSGDERGDVLCVLALDDIGRHRAVTEAGLGAAAGRVL